MTEPAAGARCRWCGRPLPARAGPGRPRRYCRAGCRQQAYAARRLAQAHGLADGDVVVRRAALEDLQDRLYALQAALEDVERDLAGSPTADEYRDALTWLRSNAQPLAEVWIEPRTSD